VFDFVGGASVVGRVSIASAVTPAPTVVVTPYSPVVSGNIGTATAGVEVQVALERDGSAIDTAPIVATDGSGAWTATLPIHAPLAPETSLADEVMVSYAGAEAPTPSSSHYDVSSSWGALGSVISSDGSTITIYCGNFGGCAPSIPVSVHYSNGSTGSFNATPVSGTSLYAPYSATLSPAVTAHDIVQYRPAVVYEDGTNLSLVLSAGLPDVTNNYSTSFSGVRLPTCNVDLAIGAWSCEGLRIGATYEVQQSRQGAVIGSQNLTATEAYEGVGGIGGTFAALETGDTINVVVPAENGEPARTVSVMHILPLRVDALSTLGSTLPSSLSGSCPPGEMEEEALLLCSPSGSFENDHPYSFAANLQDDLSGSSIYVSLSQFAEESPANGAIVPSSFTATAKLTNEGKPDTASAVSLAVTPQAGGSAQTLAGNANAPGGIPVSLVPGTYTAVWQLTDAHGDTNRLTTEFTVQAGASTEHHEQPQPKTEPTHEETPQPPKPPVLPPVSCCDGPVQFNSAQVTALLREQLVPSGKTASIGSLLKHGGMSLPFTAPASGTVTMEWFEVPAGAKLAGKTKAKAKAVLVAKGQSSFVNTRPGVVKMRLTTAGRKLLKHSKRIRLEAKGTFVTAGERAVGVVRGFVVGG
jgi:hypothetical protein